MKHLTISLNPHKNDGNKILLYKTVLEPINLSACPIWASASTSVIYDVQLIQNKSQSNLQGALLFKK